MDCERAVRENVIERYLNGTLSPAEKEEWEQHYFGCEECAERLETWHAIQGPLRERAPQIRQEMRPPRGAPTGRPWWVWAGAGIAAAAAAAVVAFLALPPPAQAPAPPIPHTVDYGALARLEPPT